MVYTVTFNPSLDYILDVPELVDGAVNRSTAEKIYPGGKGVNVSIVLDNLSVDNRAICFVAGFTGQAFKTLVAMKNINADFIEIGEGVTRINVKLRGKTETEINGRGPVIATQYIKNSLYEKLGYLDEQDFLVLAGSIPDSMPDTTYSDIAQLMEYSGCKVIVDATGELLKKTLEHKPFLIKPNASELGKLFDVKIEGKDMAIEYAKKLQDMGARNVIVSMAGEGAVMVSEDGQEFRMEAPKGEVKNSVGAGDSMLAGFLAGYIESDDFGQAFKMGVCTGSASAFSEELATKAEVDELLKNV
jgi:1-phosphofructokinase